jgi:hypothetical protein
MKTQLTLRCSLILAVLIAVAGVANAQGGKTAGGEFVALQVSLQEETFSLSLADASALLRKFPTDADRHKELVSRVDARKARLERLIVVRTISGQQAKGESIHELIYPTEFAPTRAAKTNSPAATAPAEGAVVPGGFQTRNIGDTLNFTPQIAADARTINITLIPESSAFAGYKGAGDSKWTRQPLFSTQRLTTSVVVKDGEPFLLGTFTPPAGNGIAPPPKEPRVWLEFITAHVLPVGK